jgi:glycyl-tRNA synthetase (class II)
MGARVLDVNGKEVTPIMGSYGIGIERILTAAVEQSNDKNGFWLPASIAPFTVVVTVTNMTDALLKETGETLAAELEAAGLDVLLDDRDERAGVKFKDADLVGIPYRINVGKKAAEGKVELVTRATSTSVDVALSEVVALVKKARRGRCAADGRRVKIAAISYQAFARTSLKAGCSLITVAETALQGAAMALKIRIPCPQEIIPGRRCCCAWVC